MKFEPGQFYHVYNRGNNKQEIFFEEQNYIFFLKKMRIHIKPKAKILAYCLMPNHFHWLLYIHGCSDKAKADCSLNLEIGTLLSSYAKAVNKKYERIGSLFQQKTKAAHIDTQNYIVTCFHYIHQNPMVAGLEKSLGEWIYSSYPDYSGKRNGTLIDKQFALQVLGINENPISEMTKRTIDPQKIKKIY